MAPHVLMISLTVSSSRSQKLPGLMSFEHTISACDVTQRLPADFKVCLFISREVQMIVAKPAAPPLAAASSQEHYLSGIFIVYRVISLHFHVKSSFLRRGPAMRQFRRGFDAAALRQLFAHLLPIALRHGSLKFCIKKGARSKHHPKTQQEAHSCRRSIVLFKDRMVSNCLIQLFGYLVYSV